MVSLSICNKINDFLWDNYGETVEVNEILSSDHLDLAFTEDEEIAKDILVRLHFDTLQLTTVIRDFQTHEAYQKTEQLTSSDLDTIDQWSFESLVEPMYEDYKDYPEYSQTSFEHHVI